MASRVGTERTVENYRGVMKRVQAGLGHVTLAKLRPEHVDRFLRSQADAGYSKSYVGRMRILLADCLAHAERRGLVVRNAAALSVMPKCKPTLPRRSMTVDEVHAFVTAARGGRDQRKRQAEERLAAGPLWQEGYLVIGRSGDLERSNAGQLVFASEIGTALDPSHLRRTFERVAGRAGIGR